MALGRVLQRIRVQGDLQRLRQPRPDVVHARAAQGAQAVQAEPGGGGDQPALRIADHGGVGALPAQPGVLDDVLGVAAAAQQAVGQGEQAGAVGLEGIGRSHAGRTRPGGPL